ncbi:hypothetical protein Lal_00048689 [Lupinus albus]|nr:hypothetical protein Lal_00048689 [Lupinus albus]
MDKSKICLSFILLFSFLLSSHVLAYELPETSLTQSSFDSVTQRVLDNGFPLPPDDPLTSFQRHEVVGKSDLSKDITEADKLGLENRKWEWNCGIGGSHGFGLNGGANLAVRGINNGKSDLSKDIAEADKLTLKNRKLEWICRVGGGNPSVGGNGGIVDIGGIGNGGWDGEYRSTGYVILNFLTVIIYNIVESMNYKDASIMKHQNMKKFSEFNPQSFSESQTAKKFGMKNDRKIYYGGIPRIENTYEDKKN